MALTVKYIYEKYNPLIIVHPLSERIFDKFKIPYQPLSDFFNDLPIEISDFKHFLTKNSISHVFCSLSVPYRDLTNSNLIKASNKINKPTFGLLDHWKGYDRFFDNKGKTSYSPDFIGCIDDNCKKELFKFFHNKDRIFITGNPHLENVLKMKDPFLKNTKEINILIVSQPEIRDRSYKSMFIKKINDERIIDKIHSEIAKISNDINLQINYRPHPKEIPPDHLPENMIMNDTDTEEEVLKRNDIFIGLDSMLLIEASLIGKYCISLSIPELPRFQDFKFPYEILIKLKDLNSLSNSVKKAVESLRQGYSVNLSDLEDKLTGSLERSVHFFEEFIKYKSQ